MRDIVRDIAKLKAAQKVDSDLGAVIVASRAGDLRPRRARALLDQWSTQAGIVGRIARADLRIGRVGQSTAPIADPEAEIAQAMGSFFADPLGFVLWAYEWGNDPATRVVHLAEPFDLIYHSVYGPDAWACELLTTIGNEVAARDFDGRHAVDAIRVAVASGHGIGKSAITAWLADWLMSTRPNARGVVTASTSPQLESKTWSEIAKWTKRCITSAWFDVSTGRGSMKMVHKGRPESWSCFAQTSREENSESFAGLHAADSSAFYLVDEASAVSDAIHEVMQGGLTDGHPFLIAFGNPTRNTGWFFDAFNGQRHRYLTRQIDSRSVAITNKTQLGEWVEDFGEGSDFVKVRVRGVFPSQSSMQFIGRDLVDGAQSREVHVEPGEAACVGVDVARFGDDASVIRTRVGRDARSWPPVRLRGADTMVVASRVSEHVNLLRAGGHRVVLFVDGGGVGGGVVDRLRQLGHDVVEVNFGSKATDSRRYANKRAEIWGLMKDWLAIGAIEKDEQLATDLTSVEYGFTVGAEAILLERKANMKARGLSSPDDADALAITFAQPVALPPPDDAARNAYARAAALRGEHGWVGWIPASMSPAATNRTPRDHDPYRDLGSTGRRSSEAR